jgi:membrane protein YqaA with SNARE-associated domain
VSDNKWIIACILGSVVGVIFGYLLSTLSKPSYSQIPAYHNTETIVWVDWRGRERKIEIHREAGPISR